jgi:hypothetical protein
MAPGHVVRRAVWLLGVLAATLGGAACAPVFSDLQSARLVGPGKVEVTPSVSRVEFSDDDDDPVHQSQGGVQVGIGLHDAVDLRVRYEYVDTNVTDSGVHVFGVGPKLRLVADRLALYVPVGKGFAEGESTHWNLHPTLLFTLPIEPGFDVNAAGKVLFQLTSEDEPTFVAFNLGLGVGPAHRRWALRPEVGILLNPGDSGQVYHFSLGLSFNP